MICDPTVEIICDECSESKFITPNYVYNDYSGNSGHYDCRDSSLEKQLKSDGWECPEEGKHICDQCVI